MYLKIVLLVILCCATTTSPADIISGKVIAISDGDTLTIKNKYKFKIRLHGIDSPEMDQPHGDKAKKALADLVNNKTVKVHFDAFDDYKRVLGTVYLDNINVNATMIKNGHAWVYRQYTNNKQFYRLEEEAREKQLGLWALPEDQRIAPWVWRHKYKKNQK